jgi:hypothetical protein
MGSGRTLFTYHLMDGFRTLKQKRVNAEKAVEAPYTS